MSSSQAVNVPSVGIRSVARRPSFETATTIALIGTSVLAAILVIPSANIPLLPTKAFILAAGAIITLALYIVARLSRGNIVLPPLLLFGALWLPVLSYALSTVFSGTNVSLAVFGNALDADTFGFILVLAVLGSLTALVLRRVEQYRQFFTWSAYALALAVVASLLAIIIGQFAPNSVSPTFALSGSFEDLAGLAGLGLVLGLLALRSLMLSTRSRLLILLLSVGELMVLALANISLLWILVALLSLALFVEAIMNRGLPASEADLEGAALFSEHEPAEASERRSIGAPLIVLAVSLFFLIGSSLGSALSTALHANVLNVRPSWESTLTTGKHVYASTPIFGSGPDSFGSAWLLSRSSSLNTTVFWDVDFTSGIGYIPTSFVSTGLLGALAWLILFGILLWTAGRALLTRAPEDPYVRFALLAGFVGALYLLALMVFSVPGPVPLALSFIFVGLVASTLRYARGATQRGIVFAKSPRLGFVIVFGLTLVLLGSIGAAYGLIERYVGTVDLTMAQNALAAGNTTPATTEATSAASFAPSPLAYQTQAAIASGELSQIANGSPSSQAAAQFQSTLSSGISAALAATKLNPNDYQSWLALGNLYAAVVPLGVQGAYDNAKQAYQKAETLNPSSPSIPYLMAELDISDKNDTAAEADLTQAITLKQDYTQAIFLLSQLDVSTGDLKSALNAAVAAAYFTPNDPNILFQVGILEAANGSIPNAIQALSASVAADPQFANARYFLAVAYAENKDYTDALTQLNAIGALSSQNQQAVAPAIAALETGKNPFPANLLAASSTPVSDSASPQPVSQ